MLTLSSPICDLIFVADLILMRHRHELFIHLWKDQNEYTGVLQSPLIKFMEKFKFAEAEARGFKWDFKIDEVLLLGYIGYVNLSPLQLLFSPLIHSYQTCN